MSAAERRPLPYAWDDLRGRLQRDIDALLRRLFPAAHPWPQGSAPLFPLNPTRNDRKPGSFVVWRDNDRKGAWKDFATGEQGDVFQLIGYVERLVGTMDAYWWALDFLGLERRGDVTRARTKAQDLQDRERRERERKAAEAKAEVDAEEKAAALFKLWLELPPIAGTVAEAYLRQARRIPIERLARPMGALRFEARGEHYDGDTGEFTTWPAMVSAMTRGSKVVGLHRTFLAPDGSGKAPVSPAKKMFGSVRGAAIRLTAGPSGLSPAKAAKAGRTDPLMIGEGIETTATCAVARPDLRAWAAGSLSLMGLLEWPACASAVVLLRDNDWKPEAQKAFAAVEAHWRGQAKGRPVAVAASAQGSDFNDWVKG